MSVRSHSLQDCGRPSARLSLPLRQLPKTIRMSKAQHHARLAHEMVHSDTMTETMTGGCQCGEVRYRLAAQAMPPVYCCHCLECQTWSGSAFTEQAVVGESQIEVTQGETVIYCRTSNSGAESTQHVCRTCHTRLWNTNSARAGIAVLRAGTLDASDTLLPRAHIWVKRKQPWIVIADGVPSWPESPPPGEFAAALRTTSP